MCNVLREIAKPDAKTALQKFYYGLLFIVCALHTTLEARKIFQPRGVANDPGWNSQDPVTISQMLSKILLFDTSDEQMFITRVQGICSDVVYGVQTKDKCDLVLINDIVKLAFHQDLIKFLFRVASG